MLRVKTIVSFPYLSLTCRSPLNTFVGLKNGGATCYMNAVFQQLFMQPSIRKMLLSVPESSDDQTENVFFQMQASKESQVLLKQGLPSWILVAVGML